MEASVIYWVYILFLYSVCILKALFMKQFILLAIVIIAITGCSKNNNSVITGTNLILEGKFQTEKTVYLKPMVMYVQNRQITDPAIINPYLSRHGYSAYFSAALTQIITDTVLSITFGNNDSVSYKVNVNPGTFHAKKMQSSPSEWLFQRYDSISLIVFPPGPLPKIRCDTLSSFVHKITPITHYVNNITYGIHYIVPRFALQIINGELNLPMVTMASNSYWNYPSSNGNCSFVTWDLHNIKKDNIENNLLPRDTIVVQEKNVKMVKIF